jgi:hypothetical protein
MALDPKIPQEVIKTNQAALHAYSEGSETWFDFLAPDVTVYSVSGQTPFVGREAYREYFEPSLTKGKRAVNVTSMDGKFFNDRVLLMQNLTITEDNVQIPVRQSIIYVQTGDRWLVDHLHTALAGAKPGREGFVATVLNERIATVAAVVGVAQ